MKKLLFAVALLISFCSFGQSTDSTKITFVPGYGWEYDRGMYKKFLSFPYENTDTTNKNPGQIKLFNNTPYWVGTDNIYHAFGGGGGGANLGNSDLEQTDFSRTYNGKGGYLTFDTMASYRVGLFTNKADIEQPLIGVLGQSFFSAGGFGQTYNEKDSLNNISNSTSWAADGHSYFWNIGYDGNNIDFNHSVAYMFLGGDSAVIRFGDTTYNGGHDIYQSSMALYRNGLWLPHFSQEQRDAFLYEPKEGLLYYQTNNTPGFYYYNGAAWAALSGASSLVIPNTQVVLGTGTGVASSSDFTYDGTQVNVPAINNPNGDLTISGDGNLFFTAGNNNSIFNTNVRIGDNTTPTVALDVVGDAQFAGNVFPSTDSTYDLGSSSKRWKDLWLTGGTAHIGNANISDSGYSAGKVLTVSNSGKATWVTPSSGGITALTGDVTASGSGSVAATLATVNGNVGSFTNASITVNGKGLITAVSSGSAAPSAGNPSASIGLSAVNGSASTFMRSDGAPALSQSIAPTWTGIHTFAGSGGGNNLFNITSSGTATANSQGAVNISPSFTGRATASDVVYGAIINPSLTAGGATQTLVGTRFSFSQSSGVGSISASYAAEFNGHIRPSTDNTYTLGANNFKWSTAYIGIVTSLSNLNYSGSTTLTFNNQQGSGMTLYSHGHMVVGEGNNGVTNAGYMGQFKGDFYSNGYTSAQLTAPTISSVTNVGTTGSTTYTYVVVARLLNNGYVVSAPVSTTTGNATLSVSNYNVVAWAQSVGAYEYDVYRTVGGATQGKITTKTQAATGSYGDQGAAGDGTTPPTGNSTGNIVAGGTSTLFRTTNAGSDIGAIAMFNTGGSSSTAGSLAYAFENTTGMMNFLHANGTRLISSAQIGINNLINTAGSEAGDLVFKTGTAGGAPTTRLTIAAAGDITATGNFNITGAGTTGTLTTGQFSITGGSDGDIFYQSSGNFTRKSLGTANQILGVTNGGTTLEYKTITAGSGISITPSAGAITIAATGGSGSVTSVAQSFTGGLISVAGSPITTSGTLALTVAGTSGGIPYFSSASTWASSAALAANALVVGGGAGAAPLTTTTGTGVLTALGVNVGSAGAVVLLNGAGGTPSSLTLTNATGYLGTVNGNTFTSGSSTYKGTSGQTYTFPTTSATIARIDAPNTFVGANNFTNGIAVNTSSTVYRTTNGGANVSGSNNFNDITGSASTAGALGIGTSTTTGLLDFTAANGTRRIARAGIGLTNLVNTAGSESADFIISVQSGGAAATEKLRVASGGDLTVTGGGEIFATVGKGVTYKSGTGARAGNATLVAGTVTVTNTTVTANTVIMLTRKTAGGTIGTSITYTLSAGASFTINSDNPLDTSTFSYVLSEVN